MKWVLISSYKSTLQEYHLMENDECKVVMKYNPLHHSARINCANQQRLFFIESTGSLTGKYIFKNEYGMEIGNMSQDKWFGKDGSVIIESKKYTYCIKNNPLAEFTIYESISQQPLVSCGLDIDTGIPLSAYNTDINNKCLLLGLCWYLFLPAAKENLVEYAA